MAAEITLRNPLPETLEDCCFSIEGANLTGGSVICERSRFHQHFSPPFNIKNKKNLSKKGYFTLKWKYMLPFWSSCHFLIFITALEFHRQTVHVHHAQ